MKKKVTCVSVLGIFLSILFVCPVFSAPYVIKLGHVAAPTAPYGMAADEVAKAVKELTNGEVEVQVFPSSQLGGQSDLLQGVIMGTIDVILSSSAALTQFAPKVQLIDLPFIFRDRAHVYGVLDDPEIAADLYSEIPAIGKYICTWENGMRQLMNGKVAIKSPEDAKGLKMRSMESSLYMEMFKAIGTNPTPMAYGELYTALQQGVVDGCDQTTPQVLFDRLYEVQKYLTITNHSYSPEIVIVSQHTYKRVPAEYMEILEEQLIKFKDWNREIYTTDEEKYIQELTAKGMEVIRLTPAERQQFVNVMHPVWALFEDAIGKDLIQKVIDFGK